MKVLIFEDEKLTAERLADLLKRYDASIEVLQVIGSVKTGIEWFSSHLPPDLIFMDIRLSDGISFELFERINIEVPIIFTTAYDEYALRAFKVNSIDYLVKPYDFKDLKTSIDKFKKHKLVLSEEILKSLANRSEFKYKNRFLIKIGDRLKFIDSTDIAYFRYDTGLVDIVTRKNSIYQVDLSLDQIEKLLNPDEFFRLNRKYISRITSIGKIHTYFNSRLKVELIPPASEDIIISRERVNRFKEWLGS